MMNKSLDKLIQYQVAERLSVQRAMSAAGSMMIQLKIQQGSQLRFILKQLKASSNQEAICYWLIEKQNGQLVDEASYPHLLNELRACLQKLELDGYA